jgi:hypothetical protein
MVDEITPTLTLAKLYEAQNELVDAVNIYTRLNKELQSDDLRDKIEELTDTIFKHINREYRADIFKIFSKKELRYFRIIPGSNVNIARYERDKENVSLGIKKYQEVNLDAFDQSDNIQEPVSVHKEATLSTEELDAIEDRLLSGNNFELKNEQAEDPEYLKKERERLLKKLKSVEQKLDHLAKEGDNPENNETIGSTELEDPK